MSETMIANESICYTFVALAAASSPLGVVGGAFAGHGVATLVIFFKLHNVISNSAASKFYTGI